MAKTSKQIQGDIYQMLRHSVINSNISGDIYRRGCRPKDSILEDAVVIFTTGLTDEIQTGVVTVNIYVPDFDPYENGVFIENGERTEYLERLADEWVQSLSAEKSCYKFSLGQTIYTEEEESIKQHFIVVKLKYRYFSPLNY